MLGIGLVVHFAVWMVVVSLPTGAVRTAAAQVVTLEVAAIVAAEATLEAPAQVQRV